MKKFIAIQTDFGTGAMSVAAMHGVIHMVDEEIIVEDSNNDVIPFDVLDASDSLLYQFGYWPKGTVFVSVVDPGVGTKRKASVAKLNNGYYVVTPDNGTLTYLKEQGLIDEIREIDESINRLPNSDDVHIFHGRDIFAYCAARLVSGIITYEQVGEKYPLEDIVMVDYIHPEYKDGEVSGMISEADHNFGLIGTNIPFAWMKEAKMEYFDDVNVIIEHDHQIVLNKDMKLVPTFGDVPVGDPLIFSSETRTFMLAINRKNAVSEFHVGMGTDWKMTIKKIK